MVRFVVVADASVSRTQGYHRPDGAAQERFSLDYWCRRFGIASPKGEGIDGSQVGDFYRAGRLHEIAKYCLRDAEATGSMYKKLEHTLVDLWLRR